MRAAVTEGVGAMAVLERPEPAEPGPGRGRGGARGGRDLRLGLPLLPRRAVRRQPAGRSSRGSRAMRSEPRSRRSAPIAGRIWSSDSGSRCGRCGRAGSATRAASAGPNTCDYFELIGIHTDGGLQAAASRPRGAGLPDPGRRSRAGRAGRAGVDRRARGEPREHLPGRARGRARGRPDRPVHLPGGARARRRGAGGRPAGHAARAEPRHGRGDTRLDRPRRGRGVRPGMGRAGGPAGGPAAGRARRWRSMRPERRRRCAR